MKREPVEIELARENEKMIDLDNIKDLVMKKKKLTF